MPNSPDPVWYVVRTNPRCEERALKGLLALGVDAHLPRGVKLVRRRHCKAKQPKVFPLMTGYLFAGIRPRGKNFWHIREIDGVHSILGRQFDDDPIRPRIRYVSIPASIVAEFIRLETEGAFTERDPDARDFAHGDRVAIKSGPLKGMEFVFDDYFGRASAKVVANLLGMSRVIEASLANLQRVA